MCSLLHRSHGGRTLSPFFKLSMRDTISALYGPSSRSFSLARRVVWKDDEEFVVGSEVEAVGKGDVVCG